MITVTINSKTSSIADIRAYSKLLEKEYLLLDAKYKALQEQMKPVMKFFNETPTSHEPEPKKRMSKNSALELAIEEQEKIIQMKAMKKAKRLS